MHVYLEYFALLLKINFVKYLPAAVFFNCDTFRRLQPMKSKVITYYYNKILVTKQFTFNGLSSSIVRSPKHGGQFCFDKNQYAKIRSEIKFVYSRFFAVFSVTEKLLSTLPMIMLIIRKAILRGNSSTTCLVSYSFVPATCNL